MNFGHEVAVAEIDRRQNTAKLVSKRAEAA
jgi:hypothetical protein